MCRIPRVDMSGVQWRRQWRSGGFISSKLWDFHKPVDAVPCSLPDLRRVDFDVLAVGTHGFALLVSSQGLPHVESVGAIGVVVYYSSVDGVSDALGQQDIMITRGKELNNAPHLLVKLDGSHILHSDEQVHEPAVSLVAGYLEGLGEFGGET